MLIVPPCLDTKGLKNIACLSYTTMASSDLSKPTGEFRECLPDLSIPRFTHSVKLDARAYAHEFKSKGQPPWIYKLYLHWLKLYQEPFKGVTFDGIGGFQIARRLQD